MQKEQLFYQNNIWQHLQSTQNFDAQQCQIVLAFGAKKEINIANYQYLREKYKNADILLASTAGEVIDDKVLDDSLVITAIQFEKTQIVCFEDNICNFENSFQLGKALFNKLPKENLKLVFTISDGGIINGSELVEGFMIDNQEDILITGGLAGDGSKFESTLTGLNENIGIGNVIAVGFYGDSLLVGHGSLGGWDEFGHERTITKSDKNTLYELDYKNALELYKQYLGPYAEELPSSALLFPLSITVEGDNKKNVRTILSVNELNKSMTFAGNMPEGSKVRLMKANFDKIVHASSIAAKQSVNDFHKEPDLAIAISCVGRKLILNERTDEEIEAAKAIFGEQTYITGFYSYGEVSPLGNGTKCELLNQTMSITTISEI